MVYVSILYLPNEKAKLRSSVGRAYYAAFGKARNHLRDIDGDQILSMDPPKVNVHTYVRNKGEIDVTGLTFEIHLISLNNIYYLNNIVYQYLHPCDIGTHPPNLKPWREYATRFLSVY